jgi:hypothetical protein
MQSHDSNYEDSDLDMIFSDNFNLDDATSSDSQSTQKDEELEERDLSNSPKSLKKKNSLSSRNEPKVLQQVSK